MAHRSVIPFGPQHPVLPEPLHLDLVIEDDRVIEAIPQIGFVHRGLEKLTEKRDMHQFGYIAERICGICAVGHSYGYASVCERMLDIEVPGRVQYIHYFARAFAHPLAPAVAGPARRCLWLRGAVLSVVDPARADSQDLREHVRWPRDPFD